MVLSGSWKKVKEKLLALPIQFEFLISPIVTARYFFLFVLEVNFGKIAV